MDKEEEFIDAWNKGMVRRVSDGARPWVCLTDKEIDEIYKAHHTQYGECKSVNFGYERAIEAKLKEKNGG